MKILLIVTFCSTYLFVSCAVSKCYLANNLDLYPSNLTVEECKPQWLNWDFCATATWKNGEDPDLTCEDEVFCTNCSDSTYCKKPGEFVHDYPGLSNVKITVTCCDTDLCNVETSAKTLYRISFSCLTYVFVLNLFNSTSLQTFCFR